MINKTLKPEFWRYISSTDNAAHLKVREHLPKYIANIVL